jgi:hypothetical protein
MQMNLLTELPQLYLFQIESSNWNNISKSFWLFSFFFARLLKDFNETSIPLASTTIITFPRLIFVETHL